MSSKYPNEYDEFKVKHNAEFEGDPDGDFVMAEDVNSIQSSIENIQTVLGINPQGSDSSVANRLIKMGSSSILHVPSFLVYLGVPSIINNSGSLEEAVSHFARFKHVVFGRLFTPEHGSIIKEVTKVAPVSFYGYIDAGVTTLNLSIPEISTRVQQWISEGAKGIYLDNLGYENEVSRDRQNQILDIVHAKGGVAILNAPQFEDILTDAEHTILNPNWTVPNIEKGDIYHYESFGYDVLNGGSQSVADLVLKMQLLYSVRKEQGIEIFATSTIPGSDSLAQSHYDYAHGLGLLTSVDAFHVAEVDRAEGTNQVSYYETLPLSGDWYETKVTIKEVDGGYERDAKFGKIRLDEDGIHFEGISIPASLIRTLPSSKVDFADNTLDGSVILDGSIEDQKIASYDGNRLIDTINSITDRGVRIHFDNNVTGTLPDDVLQANVIQAINLYTGTATIGQAKIGSLDAEKITTGTLQAERISASVIAALDLYAANMTVDSATINTAVIGELEVENISANVIEAINLETQTAVIGEARIGNLSAEKITAGDIAADRIRANVVSAVNAYVETMQGQNLTFNTGVIGILEAKNIKAAVIEAINANIGTATIDNAKIGNLTSEHIQAVIFEAIDANITNAKIDSAHIGTISADHIKASVIAALAANIGIATIDSAVIGELEASHIQAAVFTAINANIQDARINSAVIGELEADKISANVIQAINANIGIATIDQGVIGSLTADHIKTAVIDAINANIDVAWINSAVIGNLTSGHIEAAVIDAINANIGTAKIDVAKINNLTADHIKAVVFEAIEANITNATIDAANIGELKAENIQTEVIKAINANIGQAKIDGAVINTLQAEHIQAEVIKAINASLETAKIGNAHIGELTSDHIKAEVIQAINANIGTATIAQAIIPELTAEHIKTAVINAINANISTATINQAKIGELTAEHIQAEVIQAINANINTAWIDQAIIPQLTSEHIEAAVINAINANIGTATIDSAVIGDISADKIKTGKITADLIQGTIVEAINLYAANMTAESVQITDAIIANVHADKIDAGDISADRLQVNTVKAINAYVVSMAGQNLKFDNALIGVLTSDHIEAAVISAINANIGTAVIDSAVIGDISADKIKTGKITSDLIQGSIVEAINLYAASMVADSVQITDAIIKSLDAEKITTGDIAAGRLQAHTIEAINTYSQTITTEDARIKQAAIGNLNAEKITAGTIEADRIKSSVMEAMNLYASTLTATDATIDQALIKELSAEKINSGDIDADRLTAGVVTAINANIGTAKISNAKIDTLTADHIKAIVIQAVNFHAGTATIDSAVIPQLNAAHIETNVIEAINANIGLAKIDAAVVKDMTAEHIKANVVEAINLNATTAKIDAAKIKSLTAEHIRVAVIDAINANIGTATIDAARIKALTADHIKAVVFEAIDANINNAQIDSAHIKELSAGHIEAVVMDAIQANIGLATIDQALIGNLTANHIKGVVVDAINAWTGTARIDQGIIGVLDAGKITTGSIDADRMSTNIIAAVNAEISDAKIKSAVIDVLTSDHIKGVVVEAINLKATTATIEAAKIGALDASKITTGSLDAERLQANIITAINAEIREAKIQAAQIGSLTTDNLVAAVVQAVNLSAGNATIDAAKIKALTADHIKASVIEAVNANLDTVKIRAGLIDALTAGHIETAVIDAINANIDVAKINSAVIDTLTSGHIKGVVIDAINFSTETAKIGSAKIGELSVDNIKANVISAINLETQTAKIASARIDALTAGHIQVAVIDAINANIGTAVIAQGKIGELDAGKITTGSLAADRIATNVIAAINADIQTAKIGAARIDDLTVAHIKAVVIEAINLETQTAKIGAARIDALTAGHIAAAVIEAINLETQTAQIQSARIADLNATKITAGDINADRLMANVVKAINAELQTAVINEAKIGNLTATKITAGDIHAERMKANVVDAVNLKAGIITAGSAIIDSAAIGTLAASHMQVAVLAAINAYVGTATIDKAKIGQLDADNIEANAIVAVKIMAGAVIADKIATDAIETRHIKAEQIVARHIAVDAITAGKINADAITAREIQADAILTKHIMADAVTAFEIAANAVTAEHILAGEITTGHLAADSITTDKIAAGAVTATEIEADAIKAIHIDALAVQTEHLAAGSVKADQIDALAVTAGKIDAEAVTASTIAAGAVVAGKIAADAVTANTIKANAVTTDKLFASAVTADKISANAITATKIMADSIDATKIATDAITAKHIAFNTLHGDVIRSRTIHGDKIIAGTLSANILEAGSITSVEIAAKTITTRNLAAGSVDADVIRAGTITAGHISTRGLDAEQIEVYNGSTGQTLIQGGFLIVDGLDVGVVQSDNLIGNGLFLTASSAFGNRQDNPDGITESREAVLGNQANAQGGHQVWKIDLMDDNVLRKIEIPGRKPVDIAIDMDDTYAYITVQGDDTVVQMALDSANHGEVLTGASRNAGKGPGRIRFTGDELGDHKHFFIMNTDPKDVNIPDLLTIMDAPPTSVDQLWYVHHNIPIGNGPYDSITNTAHQTYISLSKQGDIAWIDMTNHNSAYWKVVGNIPIAAYATDNYHGGLDGNVGLNNITAGDSSSKYSATASAGATMQHAHGGYGTSDGSLVTYEPRGLAFSADGDHIYVADYANNQLVVVDVKGNAPYNALTGDRRTGNLGVNGNPFAGGVMPPPPTDDGHVHSLSVEQEEMVATIQAGGHGSHGVTAGVDTTTKWVRYRIPIGQSPDFVEIVNGKIFITLEGSGRMAIIDEADILAEIDLDRIHYANWNEFFPMRALPTWNVRTVHLGSKPSHMKVHATMGLMGTIYVSLMGQNQIAVLDVETETVSKYINVGASPKGIAFTQDGRYMYVVNHGGGGELAFVYPRGNYIGDPYLGLEGGVEYQGAEHWVPTRSKTHVNKDTGVVESQAKVEFRINEPFLNEGGYAKLSVFGKDIGQGTVYAQIEQDVTAVTNYSNGNNVRDVDNQRLDSANDWKTYRPRLGWIEGTVADIQIFSEMRGETLVPDVDGKTFRPSKGWIDGPTKPTIFKGTTGNYVELRPEEYVNYYHGDADPRIVFNELIPAEMEIYSSSYYYKTIPAPRDYVMYYDESTDPRIVFNGELAPGSWVTADFTHRDNRYWKPHNGSVSVAIENASSPNFYTQFEVEEFVPKFISIDNLQTGPFTFAPIHNPSRTVAEYTGIQYSLGTNRAMGAVITASSVPTTGVLASIVDGQEPIDTTDEHAGHMMSVGAPVFTAMHVFGEEVVFPAGLQHVVVDLGGTFMIGKVVIQHAFHKKRKYHATKTEVSEDGLTWVTVFDSTVSGEYNEYTDDGQGNMVYGNHIMFDAFPIQYIRDWSNGYTEYDALWTNPVEYTENHWTEIKAFGDWEFETGYVYPANTAQAGQQIATNGRGLVTTDIPGAQVAIDLPIEFTSWWYMTYLVGPEFGQLDVEMPTVMGGSHSLFQDGTYLNKTAHKHIMSWPPSQSVKADPDNYIKAGLHRAVIRQKSGKVSIDRFRFEDYQYLTKSSTDVPKDSSLNFTRRKLVPNQAQWYVGNETQSTEGPYDTPRINTDTQLRDYSVPIKYRFVVKARMEPQGTTEERGTAYVTSAIFETGKLSSHWRMSQTQDSFPGSRIEAWDPNLPHKTGLQHFHLANGSVRGSKLMPLSVMNHHISPYAKITESKLDLNNPTHAHGHTMMMDMGGGMMMPVFMDNKHVLDSIMDWAGTAGDFGTADTLARGDHKHSEYVKMNGAGVVEGGLLVKGDINLAVDDLGNPGLVDGVDVSALKDKVDSHVGSGGTSHAVATPSTTVGGVDGAAGFIKADDQRKLNTVKEGATKTETSLVNGNIKIDNVEKVVYTHATTDGNKHVPANGTTNLNKVLKATATAGSYSWANVAWAEVTGIPTNTVANIDDAVAKRHAQNTDSGTTALTFTVGSGTSVSGNAAGVQFGNATLNPYLRWSGTMFEIYKDFNSGTGDVWSDVKALTFRNSAGTEVSYAGHTHSFANLTDLPSTFTPPIATASVLGGVKQGTNVTIAADGTISGSYATATQSLNGLFSSTDKTRLDGIQTGAINQTAADLRYLQLSGGKLVNALTLEYAGPTLRLNDTDSSAGSYPKIILDTANNQGVMLFHTEFDGELPELSGYGLVLGKSPSNTGLQKVTFNVEGNIYADGSKVWSAATLSKAEFAPAVHVHVVATQTADGFHSKTDKVKLDGIYTGSTKVELDVNGKIRINDVVSTVYAHPTTAGNNHIPSGGVAKQYLKYSASGVAIWSTIVWGDLSGAPASLVTDIDNAVSLKHNQNTDTGTTNNLFTINNDVDSTNAASVAFGLNEKAQLKWSGTGFEMYTDHSAATKVWAEVKALTFRKSDGTEVSYAGHRHFWADLMDTPTEFNPKIATSTVLGGVKQGTNISIAADGTISGAYGIVTVSTNGLMIAADKSKLNAISTSAKRVAGSGTNGSILIDDVATVVYTHPTGAGNNHVPTGGAANQFLKYSVSGVAAWAGITFGEVTGIISSTQHGSQTVETLHAVATQTTHGFFAKEDKVRLDAIESNAINQVTADNRFLKLTGGILTGNLTVSNAGDAKLVLNADTDNDVVENGEAMVVLTQDGGIVGAEIKLSQSGAADNTLVLAPFMDYNTASPIKNYSVFVHDKKIWHEGNFLKSEFTPIAHVGTGGTSHANATTSVAGFMSNVQFNKLAGISDNAKKVEISTTNGYIKIDGAETLVYAHLTGAGNNHVPTGGAANQYLKYSASGVAVWATAGLVDFSGNISDTQHGARSGGTLHAAVTTTVNGFMLFTDKVKLDGVAENANNYIHPATHGLDVITETTTLKIMTDVERTKLSGIAQNANNYVHPATHDLSIITETATLKIMTDVERTKLAGVAQNANNYVHPETHALDVITETTTLKIMTSTERTRLAAMQDSAINQATADGRYLKLTGGTITGEVTLGTDGTGVTFSGNARIYKKSGSGLKLQAHLDTVGVAITNAAGTDVLIIKTDGTGMTYNANTVWHAGNLAKSEFTASSHVGTGGASHAAVTTTVNGFMLFSDKVKMDGIQDNANNYTHPATHGLDIITETSTRKIMTDVERTKLAGIALNANNYAHPATHALDMITETATLKVMTSGERTRLANMQDNAINQLTADGRYLQLTGGSISGKLTVGSLGIQIGEGLEFLSDTNYFGANLDGRIIRMTDGNDINGTVDGGLVFQAHTTTDQVSVELLRIRSNEFMWKGDSIWHAGNLSKSEFTAAAHVGTGGTSHAAVTTATNGFMIAADKLKMDGISIEANKVTNPSVNGSIAIDGVNTVIYTHPSGDANLHVPATSTTNNTKVLKAGATAGSLAWGFVAFGEVTGSITDAQHGNRASGALHAAVTTAVNGFMLATDKVRIDAMSNGANKTTASATNGNVLIDNVQTVVYTHPVDKHVPAAGALGNFLKYSAAGTADWANIAWSDIKSGIPTTFAPSAHTHTVANITDLYTNIYTKTEVNSAVAGAGNIRAENINTFTNTNIFTKSGLVLKLQPSTEPTAGTVMFQLNSAAGNSLVTMGSSATDSQKARFVINGDLEVTGATVQMLSQEIQGDMTVSGRLDVDGDVILGDTLADQTTIKGDLRLEGNLKPIGKSLEVARFPVYGIGGDLQFQTDSSTFENIVSHYSTFDASITGAVIPPVATGAERRYRMTVAYSTVGLASDAQLKVIEYGTATSIVEFTLPMVNGFANGMVRHFVSPEFTSSSIAHTTFQASSAGTGKDLTIKYIEVVAYDYYS